MKISKRLILFTATFGLTSLFAAQAANNKPLEQFIRNRNKIRQLLSEYLQQPKGPGVIRTSKRNAYVFHMDFDTGAHQIEGEKKRILFEEFKKIYTLGCERVDEIKSIEIYGHTDLQWYLQYSEDNNKRLGMDRRKSAVLVLKEFAQSHRNSISPNVVEVIEKLEKWPQNGYHPHFLLGQCDKLMDDKLLTRLNYIETYNEIVEKLNLKSVDLNNPEVIKDLRNDEKIRELIRPALKEYYKDKFEIFRCIVIINNFKDTEE